MQNSHRPARGYATSPVAVPAGASVATAFHALALSLFSEGIQPAACTSTACECIQAVSPPSRYAVYAFEDSPCFRS